MLRLRGCVEVERVLRGCAGDIEKACYEGVVIECVDDIERGNVERVS